EASVADPYSVYHYYKTLIRLRKENDVLIYGNYALILPEHDHVYAYTRELDNEKVVVFANLFAEKTDVLLPDALRGEKDELVIANYLVEAEGLPVEMRLKPFEARVYKLS